MTVNILAIGDISGKTGLDFLTEKLQGVKNYYDIAFTVVNGENAAGLGIKPEQAQEIIKAGADVITLGNHTWGVRGIREHLDANANIIRPSNFAPHVPGRGWGIFETFFGNVCVINLIGRQDVPNAAYDSENAFFEADRILGQLSTKIVLVDFHAEATSEKHALAYHLDGRVSALWGTHTHVQTSDGRVFPGGTGYVTDIGMTGALDSIIGMKPDQPVEHFLGNPTGRYVPADGPARIEAVIFEIDAETGKCLSVEAIRVE